MNDAVLFTMLWVKIFVEKGGIITNTQEQVSNISKMYDDWCEKFYRGTFWEYDCPDHKSIVLGMCKYLEENV